jgi:hypothetical protein
MNNDSNAPTQCIINFEALAEVRPVGASPRKVERILTPDGTDIGRFVWALIRAKRNLKDFFGGNFDEIRAKIPLPRIWPLAILHNIRIPKEENRGKRFGRKAVGSFLKLAKEDKAACAFLRVGNGPGDQLEKNLHIFMSHGWILLHRKENDNYFMYHDLNLDCLGRPN